MFERDGIAGIHTWLKKGKLVRRKKEMSLNTDPIADMLSRIRNAIMRRKDYVDVPYSNFKLTILKIMKDEGFIARYAVIDQPPFPVIKVLLKYKDGESVIHELTKVSVPGRRFYAKSNNMPKVIGNLGISIISTSKGVMTNKKAKELQVGGEVICTLW